MNERILRFLNELDEYLTPIANGETLSLYHIGRSSLVMRYGYQAATHDFDVIQPKGEFRLIEALEMFGRETVKALEHDLFLDIVPSGLPPVPAGYEKRAVETVRD